MMSPSVAVPVAGTSDAFAYAFVIATKSAVRPSARRSDDKSIPLTASSIAM